MALIAGNVITASPIQFTPLMRIFSSSFSSFVSCPSIGIF